MIIRRHVRNSESGYLLISTKCCTDGPATTPIVFYKYPSKIGMPTIACMCKLFQNYKISKNLTARLDADETVDATTSEKIFSVTFLFTDHVDACNCNKYGH